MAKYLVDSDDIVVEEVQNTEDIKLYPTKKIVTLAGTITNDNPYTHEVSVDLDYPEGFNSDNCIIIGGMLGASSIPRWEFSSNNSLSYYTFTAMSSKIYLFYFDISATAQDPITIDYKLTLMKIS